ncbi:MAG: glycosyltransferase family 2 protein [Dolichospermum sp.]
MASYGEATKGSSLALEGAIHPLGNYDQDLAECPINLTGGCFWSANIAVRRELFEKVGGFDPNYPLAAHEDQDLKLRLEPITNILFVSNAIVSHPVRLISLNQALSRIKKSCLAWAYHVFKNKKALGYKSNWQFILSGYRFQTIVFCNSLIKGKFKQALIAFSTLTFGLFFVSKKYFLEIK